VAWMAIMRWSDKSRTGCVVYAMSGVLSRKEFAEPGLESKSGFERSLTIKNAELYHEEGL